MALRARAQEDKRQTNELSPCYRTQVPALAQPSAKLQTPGTALAQLYARLRASTGYPVLRCKVGAV